MTSIFLDQELNTNIVQLKNSLNLMTPESLNDIENIDVLNTVHSNLIERKKEINNLRNLNTIPSDIIDIDAYSDAIGDKIILVENRIQQLQNENAGGKRTKRRRRISKSSKRRISKSSKRRISKSSKRRRR